MPTGYRLEMSPSNRASCNGPKPCHGTKIGKGEPRFGTMIELNGNATFKWRHYGCITSKVLQNLAQMFNDPSEVDGYEELAEEYQQKFSVAFEKGTIDPADIPESAKKPEGDEDEDEDEGDEGEGKKQRKKKSKKAKNDGEGGDKDKPKRKPAAKKTKGEAGAESGDEANAPKAHKTKRKAPVKSKAAEVEGEGAPLQGEVQKKQRSSVPRTSGRATKSKKPMKESSDEEVPKAAKKRRGLPTPESEDGFSGMESEDEQPKKKKLRTSKAASKIKPKAKAAKSKVTIDSDDE